LFPENCLPFYAAMPSAPAEAWAFLLIGYMLTVLIEAPVLWVGLSRRHAARSRLAAGFWLTACTYPIVILALPYLIWEPFGRAAYLWVAEIFAPAAECLLFCLAFGGKTQFWRLSTLRDCAAIVVANLASFGFGLALEHYGLL
jgi:hypothetical protein